MRVAVITPRMRSGETGGAEALYEGLVRAIHTAGCHVEAIEVLLDESTFETVLESYLACWRLDLRAFDVVVSTKAPSYMVHHANHVSYLLHTIRVFYDMFEGEFPSLTPELLRQRELIHALDKQGLHPSRVRRHLANGVETYQRLMAADPFWAQVCFRAVHHPPLIEGFREPADGRYVFVPSRLHRWKRVNLIIEAFRHLNRDVALKISGAGEDEAELRALAAHDPRIEFLGQVSGEELLDLYAHALVVPFVPLREDYGLVTVEAFRSQKPVITCRDSGEPARLVRHGENGFVVDPDPVAIAECIRRLTDHPETAAAMGRKAYAASAAISWERVVDAILPNEILGNSLVRYAPRHDRPAKAGDVSRHTPTQDPPATGPRHGPQSSADQTYKVAVLDMQPIDPPVGGGRARLLGLYHALGERLPTTYLGTYDWAGEDKRVVQHSPSLTEIDVPLSAEHFAAAAAWQRSAGGNNVIDVSFDLLAERSREFWEMARQLVTDADILIFSHPWIFPLVKDQLSGDGQLVVYDSQNVESVLRMSLLDDGGLGSDLVRHVIQVERDLCRRADLILACSHEDRQLFHELYSVPYARISVIPNGTFVTRAEVPDDRERRAARQALGLGEGPVVLFVGSAYRPNVEAAQFISTRLAPAVPDAVFVIGGGVGEALDGRERVPANVRITGGLSDAERVAYLTAADVAINPMFTGSGTNIKMFDFMAFGLPVISTPVGARGISQTGERAFLQTEVDGLAEALQMLLTDRERARDMGRAGRNLVERLYAWEHISPSLGDRLHRARRFLRKTVPRFSVIVPTYERHEHLGELMASLAMQRFTDFEVIVVDQSAAEWSGREGYSELDLAYLHPPTPGAVLARNMGASCARGEILAFIDDDCLAFPDWLAGAAPYFEDPGVVGVEGLILSARRDDSRYRAVTNQGFEGLGFMTANLFLRRETFATVNGFDPAFEHPHFREDTDLAWRALKLGRIPFARDVRVYHPPHPRELDRESGETRAQFFEKDALLLQKHPDRFRELFMNEAHYLRTEGFAENFLRGAQKYGVLVDPFYLDLLATARGDKELGGGFGA